MKWFILIILSIFPLLSNSQTSFQISPSYFFGSSVVFDDNSSFTNFRNESKLFNRSESYGLSGLIMFRDRWTYYQTKQYGIRISILKSISTQKIVYDPTPNSNLGDIYSVTNKYSFIEVPVLFTQGATNHQMLIFEAGPVYSYYIQENSNKLGFIFKAGIHNHISKPLMYSILLSSNNTIMGRKYWRLSNGLEFNLIYKIK
jgi:hypothetical protein